MSEPSTAATGDTVAEDAAALWRSAAGIPIRNLWLLLAYANGLAEFVGRYDAEVDEATDLPDLLARLLTLVVERRLRRSLSRGYRASREDLSRVRGRIDWLETQSRALLQRGRVSCRFEDFTLDTPRNRLARAALERMQARLVDPRLRDRCRTLARTFESLGVAAVQPSRGELARDRIERHDADDRLMVSASKLALDVVLPAETRGVTAVTGLARDEERLRTIFERAVEGFYRHELPAARWSVRGQRSLAWRPQARSNGLAPFLPSLVADLVIDEKGARRIIIDTKFTGILARNRFGKEKFKSGYIYQIYTYVRSQEGRGDALADGAEGILLHPSVDRDLDEEMTVHGHRIRFVTVDLTLSTAQLRNRLLTIIGADQR